MIGRGRMTAGMLVLTLAAASAMADSSTTYIEVPVVAVEPVRRVITERIPHESCYEERVRVMYANGNHSPTSGIVGALVGGTVAGALGHNSRKQPLIAGVGAVLGASIGTDIAHRRNAHGHYVTEQRCEVEYELRDREEITGYRVSYQYGDKIYDTRMSTRPGPTIRLRVELQPVN